MRYLVESPHTKEECLKGLDELAGKGEAMLQKFSWGCESGEHTGYALIDAADERSAKEFVPSIVRSKARVHPVTTYTSQQVRSFHQM